MATNEPASIVSVEPGLVSDSCTNVHLSGTGAPVVNTDAVVRAPSSLQQLVDKYCVATREIPVERIVPGNNSCLLRHSGVERNKAAIGRSSIFMVRFISQYP